MKYKIQSNAGNLSSGHWERYVILFHYYSVKSSYEWTHILNMNNFFDALFFVYLFIVSQDGWRKNILRIQISTNIFSWRLIERCESCNVQKLRCRAIWWLKLIALSKIKHLFDIFFLYSSKKMSEIKILVEII